jgi:hypothetical protein
MLSFDSDFDAVGYDLTDDAPSSYSDILNWADSDKWQMATDDENSSLDHHNVFEVVEQLPADRKALKARYVYKLKSNGKYKARLVIKGYLQVKGVDFDKVYAPVVSKVSLRLLLAIAAVEDLHIYQLDVKTAFLHGTLKEEIYMEATAGMRYPPGTILRLLKSLYGLRQAPRVWHEEIRAFILNQGFRQSVIDRGVFIYVSVGGSHVYLAIYVDDILIFGIDTDFINIFKSNLAKRFNIDDLGEAKHILGMEIHRDRSKKLIWLSQRSYLRTVFTKYRAKVNTSNYLVPLSKSSYKTVVSVNDGAAQLIEESVPYRELLGALLYANVCTRPEISFAVSTLASFTAKSRKMHYNALREVLNYVKQTEDMAIVFGNVDSADKNKLLTYADADFAAKHNKRRSRTGYVIYLNGAPIAWKSKLQTLTATSTSEAELYAMFDATQHALQLRELLGELGHSQDILTNFEDNSGCVDWITNQSSSSSRMRGIETKYYRLQELAERSEVNFVKIPTSLQKADIFTKQMDLREFSILVKMLYNIN